MIKGVYALRDKLTGYLTVAVEDNDDVAVRSVRHAIQNDPLCGLNANPSDFTLNKLGTYDTDTGVIVPCPVTVVCEVDSLVRKEI